MRLGISPVIPTIASFLLAALWALSVFAGWGLEAFCAGDGRCESRLAAVNLVSGAFAAVAACCTAGAWVLPAARQHERVFARLMGASVVAWIVAVGVLFLGGLLAS